jgi:hypothetical protein
MKKKTEEEKMYEALESTKLDDYACKSCGAIPGEKHKMSCDTYICKHCGGNLAIRNPMGYCDHLYSPEYCKICQHLKWKWLYELWWTLIDRCHYCGGPISGHINGHDHCDRCHMRVD